MLWSATLTTAGDGSGCTSAGSTRCSEKLTDQRFTYEGTTYTVVFITNRVDNGQLIFQFDPALPAGLRSAGEIYIDGRPFRLSSFTVDPDDNKALKFTPSPRVPVWATASGKVYLSLLGPGTAPATGVEISSDSMSINEGGGGTFTVALTSDPGAATTVTLVKSRPGSLVTVAPATLTFTSGSSGNWGTAQTVTVNAPADLDARDEQLMILVLVEVTARGQNHANDNPGYRVVGSSGNAVAGVYVTVRDNDDGRPTNLSTLPGHRLTDYGGTAVGSAESQKTGWSIRFSWSAPGGSQTVSSYGFQWRRRGGAWLPFSPVNLTGTSYTIRPGYSDNTIVDYRVRSQNSSGVSDWATGSVTLSNPRNLVTSVRAVPGGDGELDVSWRPPAAPAWPITTYDVEYRKSSAPGQDSSDPNLGWVALDPVSGLSTTIGSLEHGVTYRVRVRITSEYDFAWSFGGGTAVCTSCNTAGDVGVETRPATFHADLIEDIYEWRNDPRYVSDKRHTDRWDRVLLAFGETVSDTSLTAMTADEAQGYADRGWSRWVGVAEALNELESSGQPQEPEAEVPNRAPVASAIGDVTIVDESGTQSITSNSMFEDPDKDDMTVSGTSSDTSVATVSASSDGSILTISARSRGTATITATADDGNGGTATNSFTVRVKAAPVVARTLSDISGLEAGTSQLVSLSGVFSDADGDALSIDATAYDEDVATATVSSDGASLTVAGVSAGDTTIAVIADDTDGNQAIASFPVSVTASQPVQLTPPEQTQQEQPQQQPVQSEPDPSPTPTPEPETPAQEPETEAPVPEVADVVKRYDTNGDGKISGAEMGDAINDYIAGNITYDQVVEVNIAFQAS